LQWDTLVTFQLSNMLMIPFRSYGSMLPTVANREVNVEYLCIDSTGLKVNYSTSNMYPINLSAERLNHLATTFRCKVDYLPFTYLGWSLSLNKSTVHRLPSQLWGLVAMDALTSIAHC
jgi:hypothetical protein